MSDDFYEKLRQRLSIPDGRILTYDEVMRWPEGKLDELMRLGKIREGPTSETVVCIECPDGCPIVPDVRKHPETGELFGVYVCPHDEDIGRFTVDLNRRLRWEILGEKPSKIKPELQKPQKSKRKRATKKDVENRNRIIVTAAAELKIKYDRLPSVDEVMEKTHLGRQQIYDSAPYKEGKIAKASAKATEEVTGSSVQKSEYFDENSEEHGRRNNRSKAEQAELDALIDQQADDDRSEYVKNG